ncbi:MAG: hypothetical protein ACRENE_10465 [Polyangiaceae bacterium]
MLGRVREALLHAITTPRGDSLAAVRVPKDIARKLNSALGEPLATREELARREAARARLAELRQAGGPSGPTIASGPAPVFVYFEKDRNVRELTRIEELLGARGHAWKRLEIANDEAMLDFILRTAACERDDLPVVFVADRCVGAYPALVEADVSGELARLVRGGRGPASRVNVSP